jgi:hypothetical protein
MYQAGHKETVSQEYKRKRTVWLKCQIIKMPCNMYQADNHNTVSQEYKRT